MNSSTRNDFPFGVTAVAVLLGAIIGYIDSRPTWDDTGITAAAIVIGSFTLAAQRPRVWWIIALAVGLPVFCFNYLLQGDLGASVALIFAASAAGMGAVAARAIRANRRPTSGHPPL